MVAQLVALNGLPVGLWCAADLLLDMMELTWAAIYAIAMVVK